MPRLSPPAKHNPQRRHRKEQNHQGDGNKDNRRRHVASQTSSDALDYTASDSGSQPIGSLMSDARPPLGAPEALVPSDQPAHHGGVEASQAGRAVRPQAGAVALARLGQRRQAALAPAAHAPTTIRAQAVSNRLPTY